MDSDKLHRIVSAMTAPAQWRRGIIERDRVFVPHDGLGTERVLLRLNQHFENCADAAGIVMLANHAQAMVSLVHECDVVKCWRDADPRTAGTLDIALDAVMSALEAVHAVGDGPEPPIAGHITYVTLDWESARRGGTSRRARCSCNWVGPERGTMELAADDAMEHESEPSSQTPTIPAPEAHGRRATKDYPPRA